MLPDFEKPEVGEPRPLAVAYARRAIREARRLNEIKSHYFDRDLPSETDEVLPLAQHYERILSLKDIRILGEAVEQKWQREKYRRDVRVMLLPTAQQKNTEDYLDCVVGPISNALVDSVHKPLVRSRVADLILLTDTAEELAQKNGISATDYFDDDALYDELLRESYTPEEFLRPYLQYIKGYTLEAITEAMIVDPVGIMRVILSGDIGSNMDLIGEAEFLLTHDSELQKSVANQVASIRAYAHDVLRRTWGNNYFESVSKGSYQALRTM